MTPNAPLAQSNAVAEATGCGYGGARQIKCKLQQKAFERDVARKLQGYVEAAERIYHDSMTQIKQNVNDEGLYAKHHLDIANLHAAHTEMFDAAKGMLQSFVPREKKQPKKKDTKAEQ